MQGSKQQNVINNKGGFSSKIVQKIIEITEPMSDSDNICMRFNSHQGSIRLKCKGETWLIFTKKDGFQNEIQGRNHIAENHYKEDKLDVFFIQLENNESTFLRKYIINCEEQARESVLFKRGKDDCGVSIRNPADEPAKRFTSKEMLKNYFKYFNEEYELSLKAADSQAQTSSNQLVDTKKGDIKIIKSKVASFGNFLEEVGNIVDKIEVQGQFPINLTFDYVEAGGGVEDKIPYIKLKYGKYIQFIVVTSYVNDDVRGVLYKRYVECNLCIPNSHYECKKDDEYIQFHYYKFEGNSDELDLARKYILGNTPLYSNNAGQYKGNKKEILEYFYNSTQQFCQNNQKKSVSMVISERNNLIRKNQTEAIDNFIEQIGNIIEYIPDDTTLNITIDKPTQITSENKTWIIANDPEYSQLHDYYSKHNNYNITKSELTISNPVYRLIKAKGLTSKKLKGRKETCRYLNALSQELIMHNRLADCNKISATEIDHNNTQAAYIGLGLSSTLATTLLPLYNYTTGGKSIDAKNLPRICAATNASALQQNTTDIFGHDSSENNNSNIAVILIPIFVTLAIVGILIVYCKSHHQRRNSNRNPSVSAIRNRRESRDLERGGEPLQLEERERLSIQEEVGQQSDSVNGREEDHLSPATDNEVTSSSSSNSNTLSRTESSASGTVSGTGSSSSIEEDSQLGSDLEEVRTDDSQRSPSSISAPQESPGTSMKHVQRVKNRSSWPTNIVSQVAGCLRNSC